MSGVFITTYEMPLGFWIWKNVLHTLFHSLQVDNDQLGVRTIALSLYLHNYSLVCNPLHKTGKPRLVDRLTKEHSRLSVRTDKVGPVFLQKTLSMFLIVS